MENFDIRPSEKQKGLIFFLKIYNYIQKEQLITFTCFNARVKRKRRTFYEEYTTTHNSG